MNVNRLYRLTCGVRHYDWGDRGTPGQPSFIAALLGLPADSRPFAELWVGAHPSLPATVPEWPGAPRLDDLIRAHSEAILGHCASGSRGGALPFLLKVLSCARPLSIQAHPDRELAALLHERDARNYPDPNHKPEIAIALTPFAALAAFRSEEDIQLDLRRLPALQAFFAPTTVATDWTRGAYARVFTASAADVNEAIRQTAALLRTAPELTGHDRLFSHCAELFPGDRGALSVYFLNLVEMQPGQAIFLPPNEPHAYVGGTIIECMAASDNVVRAGLTAKHVDTEVLLRMLTYRPGAPTVFDGAAVEKGVRLYAPAAAEFQVELRDLCDPVAVSSASQVSLLLVLDGEVQFSTADWESTVARGSALLWPAAVRSVRAAPRSGSARWVRAMPGRGAAPATIGM